MIKFLFLRGQVPQDRDPNEIVFDTIEEVDDVWTQLIYTMTSSLDYTELWYWGGSREHWFSTNFVERWIPDFSTYKPGFEPDIIFCRGGFHEYTPVLKRWPKAYKIYYGAGIRFLPQKDFTIYDLVLVDSYWQQKVCKERFPNLRCELFIKPAPDNLFWPRNEKIVYDICYPADGRTKRKGHDFVYSTVPSKYRVLNLGAPYRWRPCPSNVINYRVVKPELPKHYAKCKIGIVTSTFNSGGGLDSCPRVLPEMLACNLPLVVLNETLFWAEKYINDQTGMVATRDTFWDKVDYVINNLDSFSPREYYINNLSLKVASNFLRDILCI